MRPGPTPGGAARLRTSMIMCVRGARQPGASSSSRRSRVSTPLFEPACGLHGPIQCALVASREACALRVKASVMRPDHDDKQNKDEYYY